VGGDLVEVELDDEVPEPSVRDRDLAPVRAWRGAVRGRRWSARAWARLAVPLALVLAAGAGLDGAVAADLARPRPGTQADLRVPRVVEWRADAGGVLGLVGDVVVLASPDEASTAARDLRDGRVLWSLPFGGCQVVDAATEPYDPSARTISPSSARLLCQEDAASETMPTVLVDVASGTVLARLAVPDGSWGPLVSEGVAVAQGIPGGGPSDLVAFSLETGERLWSRTVGAGWTGGMDLRDGVLVIDDPEQPGSSFDLHTGEPAPARTDAQDWTTATLPDGAQVHTRWRTDGTTVSVTEPGGAVRWEADAVGSMVAGEGDGTLVGLQDPAGGLEVRRAATGEVLWTSERRLSFGVVVAGALVGADWTALTDAGGTDDDVRLVGFDPATGAELWSRPRVSSWSPGLVNDGTRFALGTDEGVDVLDARTGTTVARWRVPVDADPGTSSYTVRGVDVSTASGSSAELVTLPGGRLLLVRSREVAVLGW